MRSVQNAGAWDFNARPRDGTFQERTHPEMMQAGGVNWAGKAIRPYHYSLLAVLVVGGAAAAFLGLRSSSISRQVGREMGPNEQLVA